MIIDSRRTQAEQKFLRLRDEWHEQTGLLSSLTDILLSLPYQQIIGMGEDAVQFMLRDLEQSEEPDFWFWALKCITCDDPVPPDAAGDIGRMAEAWLGWGRERGYI